MVSAPEKLPLRFALRGGLAGAPAERREQGRRVLEWSWTDVPAHRAPEASLPPERAATPHVAFGTGRSWQAIAAGYAETVDRQLAGADLAARAGRSPAPPAIAARPRSGSSTGSARRSATPASSWARPQSSPSRPPRR